MTHVEFPLGEGTLKLISEFLEIEKLEGQLMGDINAAEDSLIELQKTEIMKMMVPKDSAPSEQSRKAITSARDKAADLDDKLEACSLRKKELHAEILASMENDKQEALRKLPGAIKAAIEDRCSAMRDFISAMAAAAVRQFICGANAETLLRSGPELSLGLQDFEYHQLFTQEFDRFMTEFGVTWQHKSARSRLAVLNSMILDISSTEVQEANVEWVLERAREGRVDELKAGYGGPL